MLKLPQHVLYQQNPMETRTQHRQCGMHFPSDGQAQDLHMHTLASVSFCVTFSKALPLSHDMLVDKMLVASLG